MKTNPLQPSATPAQTKTARRLLKTAVLGIFALTRHAEAQNGSSLASGPAVDLTPVALQTTNELQVFTPTPPATEQQPFRWGQVTLRPHLFYRFLRGDGILASPTNAVTTTIQQFSPGFSLDLGSHWTLDYTPMWSVYSSRHFRDTFDQSAQLTGGTTYEAWTFGLTQSYSASSAPLVETGTQTDQEIFATRISATRQLNSKMSLDLAINQDLRSAAQLESSREWSTLDWLNYEFRPRLQAGLGVGFGYVNVDTGANMTYEQFQGRVAWRATDKISFAVNGGLEDRQFLVAGASDALNPVAGAGIQYQPFEFTKLSANVSRVVGVSMLTTGTSQSQVTESTAVSGNLNQRLLGHLMLDIGGGYDTSKYVASGGPATNRTDDIYFFNARLSCPFLKRGNVGVFYQFTDNSSSQAGFTTTSHQVGVDVSYRF